MNLPDSILAQQDKLSTLLGCKPEERPSVVADMLQRSPSESTGYWLQLVVAAGIATLGLVLGSTAVIIGAMLIAPLMGPIVGFGMGLAVGSPFLVLRSGSRVLVSVFVVIGCSALLTRLLPFHELNSEISNRTTPTVLDLITAAFCAMAGVYATMRRSGDIATTAAGTSIGISLVPPLCTSGFGVGTLSWTIAGGAALLFLTNLVAIVFVGTLAFALSGFHRETVHTVEASIMAETHDSPIILHLARRLGDWFKGPWLRLLMPLALLSTVYIPLRTALDEVVWEIRVRGEARAAVARLPNRVIESRVRVERREVEVVVVLLGTASDAESARQSLSASLLQAGGVIPRIEAMAVPDAAAFAGLEAAIRKPVLPIKPPEPSIGESVDSARALLRRLVYQHFPEESAGKMLSLNEDLIGDTIRLEIIHLGAPLGTGGLSILAKVLEKELEKPVQVHEIAFPLGEQVLEGGDKTAWLTEIPQLIVASKRIPALSVCVVQPKLTMNGSKTKNTKDLPAATSETNTATAIMISAMLDSLLAGHPRASVAVVEGASFQIRFVEGDCPSQAAPANPPKKEPENIKDK